MKKESAQVKMFVGNATKQHHDFVYWVPGAKATRTQRIEVGRQIMISGDLTQVDVDSIVQQHAPYGLAAASEVDHLTDFVGLCYSVDKMISTTQIHKLMIHNAELLVKRGKEIRREASVAGNEGIERSVQESGIDATLRQMETSVVEENHDERSEDPAIAEGYRVIRGGLDEPAPSRRTRRRRRAA